nr:Transposase InsO for insertion sequence element IS911 [Escherichia coli]
MGCSYVQLSARRRATGEQQPLYKEHFSSQTSISPEKAGLRPPRMLLTGFVSHEAATSCVPSVTNLAQRFSVSVNINSVRHDQHTRQGNFVVVSWPSPCASAETILMWTRHGMPRGVK